MKISSITEAVPFANRVREKDEQRQRQDEHPPKHERQDADTEPEFERKLRAVDEETLGHAVESFQSDSQSQANGLNASVGPGLRVVLKDGSGAVVRQFTGEEFLRLREAVAKDGRTRGKILDQKV